MADTYINARRMILSDVLQFYITSKWEDRNSPAIRGFIPSGWASTEPVQPGDLIIMSAAPASKWAIGWLRMIEQGTDGRRYLIESLEDGEVCWWTNIGLSYMPRDDIKQQYRWSDRQFAFNKRWVCLDREASPSIRVQMCQFDRGAAVAEKGVTISIRQRWGSHESDAIPPITRHFPNYRKVTIPMLKAALAEMTSEFESIRKEQQA